MIRTRLRWMTFMLLLVGCLAGCDRHVQVLAGSYVVGATTGAPTPTSITIDRENATVWLHFENGTAVISAYTARPRTAWPSGCPANLGSTRMEVLDLAMDDLAFASTTIHRPVLVRNCPPDPVEIALRDAGKIGGAGTACASAETCLTFAWTSEGDALPPSMKGYELYSWRRDPGEAWTYTLINGTNRTKTWDEITASESTTSAEGWMKLTVSGQACLQSVLSRLPEGSQVVWIGPSAVRASSDLHDRIGVPDAKAVRAIVTYARRHGLHLAPPVPTSNDTPQVATGSGAIRVPGG